MKHYKKQDATTKVRLLKPILDDWNDCQDDSWVVEKSDYDPSRRVIVRRADRGVKIHENIHGCLVHDISCLCEACEWCWAIYFDEKDGFYMSI